MVHSFRFLIAFGKTGSTFFKGGFADDSPKNCKSESSANPPDHQQRQACHSERSAVK